MANPPRDKVQFGKPAEDILRDRRDPLAHVKQGDMPRGGVPHVRIPRLDAKPMESGGTMHQQAAVLTDPTSPLSPAYNPALVMERKGQNMNKNQGPFQPLPPEAAADPRFRPGMGSMVSGNQPQLADGGAYKPPLSQESVDALKNFAKVAEGTLLAETMPRMATHEEEEEEIESKLLSKGAVVEKQVLGTAEEIESEIRSIIGDDPTADHLNNPLRRKDIESRLVPLDLIDLIVQGELRQNIPIVPGKLEIELRSPSIDEDLSVKRLMYDEKGGDRYLLDKYIVLNLTLALVSINKQELPTHLKDGVFNEQLFLKKYGRVKKFPIQLIGDLGLQYAWFDQRVRKLLSNQTDELKKY